MILQTKAELEEEVVALRAERESSVSALVELVEARARIHHLHSCYKRACGRVLRSALNLQVVASRRDLKPELDASAARCLSLESEVDVMTQRMTGLQEEVSRLEVEVETLSGRCLALTSERDNARIETNQRENALQRTKNMLSEVIAFSNLNNVVARTFFLEMYIHPRCCHVFTHHTRNRVR